MSKQPQYQDDKGKVSKKSVAPSLQQKPQKGENSWPVTGSSQAYRTLLTNPHLSTVQRRAIAARIGSTQGNHYLSTLATSAQTVQRQEEKGEDDKKVKPFVVAGEGERKDLIPKNWNGKTLYFFFGYTGSKKDQKMRDAETADLEDDVLNAAARGFWVTYDKAGTKSDFISAIYDPTCYGVYWSGHGYPSGNVQSSDGKVIRPEDVDVKLRSTHIQYLILAACNSGVAAKKWKKAMGTQCQFEGWVNLTNTSETKDFTSDAFLDSWSSHGGMNPDKELGDYINAAEKAK